MADHRIGGVDRLVGDEAGETEEGEPEGGGDDAVGEVLGQRFDRGAGDAALVETVGVAPDDVRHRPPGFAEPARGEGTGDRPDVIDEAPAGEEDRRDERDADPAVGDRQERVFEKDADRDRDGEKDDEGGDAETFSRGIGEVGTVEPRVEPADQGAERDDGMRNAAPEPGGVTEHGIDDERRGKHPELEIKHGERPRPRRHSPGVCEVRAGRSSVVGGCRRKARADELRLGIEKRLAEVPSRPGDAGTV